MSRIDLHVRTAAEISAWLAARGEHRRAQQLRGIGQSLASVRSAHADARKLRSKLTPIAQARITERRRALDEELRTTAALLERMAAASSATGAVGVGIEAPDAAYVADLLNRAVRA